MKNNLKKMLLVGCMVQVLGLLLSVEVMAEEENGYMQAFWKYVGWVDVREELKDALSKKGLDAMRKVIQSNPAAVDTVFENGDSVLIKALKMKRYEIADLLIESGANVKYENVEEYSYTALHVLCSNGYMSPESFTTVFEIMKKLVDRGVPLNSGKKLPIVLLINTANTYGCVDRFIEQFGSKLDVNIPIQGHQSVLSYLVASGKTLDVALLLDERYKLKIKPAVLDDALHVLCSSAWSKMNLNDAVRVLKLLALGGALKYENSPVDGKYPMSILRTCMLNDNIDAMRELIKLKVNINPKDAKRSLLHDAKERLILPNDLPADKMLEVYQRRVAIVQDLIAVGAVENCEC